MWPSECCARFTTVCSSRMTKMGRGAGRTCTLNWICGRWSFEPCGNALLDTRRIHIYAMRHRTRRWVGRQRACNRSFTLLPPGQRPVGARSAPASQEAGSTAFTVRPCACRAMAKRYCVHPYGRRVATCFPRVCRHLATGLNTPLELLAAGPAATKQRNIASAATERLST